MFKTDRSLLVGYGVAVLSVAALTLIRFLVNPILGTHARFLTYILPVMFSGWYGGLGPGLLATALSGVLGPLLFPEPFHRGQSLTDRYALWELACFSAIGVVISILNNALKLEVAERRRAEQASSAQARTLVDVVEGLAQEHDLERLQGLVLAAIVTQLEASGGALWRHDEDVGGFEIVFDCHQGEISSAEAAGHLFAGQQIATRDWPGWEELKARCLRGECLQVSDLKSALWPERLRAGLVQMGVKSLVMVPMLAQSQLVGFFTVRNSQPTTYAPGKLRLAQALAHQATLAMQLTQLSEEAREAAVLHERARAVLTERNRMAREMHDTLAQAFTGIILQLGAAGRVLAEAPERGQAHLQMAVAMAREGLAEARRSVQALRPQSLEQEDLACALAQMAERLNTDPETRIQFRLVGSLRPLPPAVADHLLRIGQEAITNALRHAHSSGIGVELTFGDKKLTLRVTDDGEGFARQSSPPGGHFGLTGMQERAALIGAQLAVESQPGCGTRVELTWRFPEPSVDVPQRA